MNVIWGAMFPLTKPALETIPPITFTLIRFCVALAVLLPLAGRETFTLLRGPDGGRLALVGLMGFGLCQVAQNIGLKLSTASDIALLAATTPLWIALMARLWLAERVGRVGQVGFAVALVGVLLILWPRDGGGAGLSQRIIGDAIYMISTISWAYYVVKGKELVTRNAPLPATVAACLVGTAAIVPVAVWELASGQTIELTLVGAAGVAYAALPVTALGFVVLFWALARIKAAQAGILIYLQPLAGVGLAWWLLGERLGVEFFLGAALVLVGAYLVIVPAPGRATGSGRS